MALTYSRKNRARFQLVLPWNPSRHDISLCVWLMPRAGSRRSKQGLTGPKCLGSHTPSAPVPVFSLTVVILRLLLYYVVVGRTQPSVF